MPRIEISLTSDVLDILQVKADAAGQSRKRYLETLCIKNANEPFINPNDIQYPVDHSPVPAPSFAPRAEAGEYVQFETGYVFEYDGEQWFIASPKFFLDNFQYYFTGESGSVEDSILL